MRRSQIGKIQKPKMPAGTGRKYNPSGMPVLKGTSNIKGYMRKYVQGRVPTLSRIVKKSRPR